MIQGCAFVFAGFAPEAEGGGEGSESRPEAL